jgi:hypothetical protein
MLAEIIGAQKNVKTGSAPFLSLELTMHVIKSQIKLMRQSR